MTEPTIDLNLEHPGLATAVDWQEARTWWVFGLFAMGLGAYWRTGSVAQHTVVKSGFGAGEEDEIVGFIYLGQPKTRLRSVPNVDVGEYLEWIEE